MDLEYIAEQTKTNGIFRINNVEWLALMNTSLRGNYPLQQLETWAKDQKITFNVEYSERNERYSIVSAVTFLRSHQAK